MEIPLISILSLVLSLALLIFCIYWMIKMLSFTKEIRIIQSMTLKTLLKYFESKGVEVDIQKIKKEVEDSVG